MNKTKRLFELIICIFILLIFPGLSNAEKVKVKVIAEKANIRLKPDLQSMVIETASLGAILESEEQVGEWFKVSLPPDEKGYIVTGYIHSSTCEIITEKPVEEKAVILPSEKPSQQPAPPAKPTYQPSQPSPQSGIRVELRLFGGVNYFSGGDVNEGVKGWIDLVYDDELSGYFVEGEAKPLHLGFGLGGDIIIYFTPNIGIGLGTEYLQGTRTSELTFYNTYEGIFTNKLKISAIPIRLELFFTTPLSTEMNFILHAGPAYYLSKYSFNSHYEENGYQEDMDQEATANALGFQGGIGFGFNFSPSVALIIEGQGRYAKIGGFEGTREHSDVFGWSYTEEGPLYYYELLTMGKEYPLTRIHEEEPSDPYYSNLRDAEVDFSGFAILVGLRFKF